MKFQDAIEEIKNRINIVDVIGEYVKLKRQGANSVGLCPFHNEKTGSFMVSEAKGIYKCFGCGKGGNVYTFLMDYLNISFRDAVRMLAKRVNIDIEDDYTSSAAYKENEEKKKKMYELFKDAANEYYKILYSDLGKIGLKYLRDRKLSDSTIKKFGLGFAPNDFGYMYKIMKQKGYEDELLFESKLFRLYNDKPVDAFYNRVIFPLVDLYKHVVGFQSRTLDPNPKERKYVNSDDSLIFHKKSFLYAMNYAFTSKENYYILCEGNMDAITLHQSGYDSAIATMGTAFNESHIFLLKKKLKKVYLCQDTDEAGIKAVNTSASMLNKSNIETYVIDLKPAKDVDEFINKYGIDEFKKRIDNPIPSYLFYVSTLRSKYNIEDPYEQEKYISDIIKSLAEFSNEFVRDNYLKNVALQEKLDYTVLKNLLIKYLKGNDIGKNNILDYDTTALDEVQATEYELSKIDSNFICLVFLLPDKKDKIKSIINDSDLSNEVYKLLYSYYLTDKKYSDIYTLVSEKSEKEKEFVNKVLNDNYSYDENNQNELLESLNQIIKQIKIRSLKKVYNENTLEGKFELKNKINEINNTKFI